MDSFDSFPNLEWLTVKTKSNVFMKSVNSLTSLRKLFYLHFLNIKFDILPEGIDNLKRISVLDIISADLKYVSKSILLLNNLKNLNLSFNPALKWPLDSSELGILKERVLFQSPTK